MRTIALVSAALTLWNFATAQPADSTEEQRSIAIVLPDKPLAEKDDACARLKRIGTVRSVPALAQLLQDEGLSHSARLALESMRAPEAGKALLDALPRTGGMLQTGIIQSLGERREDGPVPALAGLLSNGSPVTASAAAAALGRIGGPAAIEPLKGALGTGEPRSGELR